MTEVDGWLARFDRLVSLGLHGLERRPFRAALLLGMLTAAVYLPGVVTLPPIDRTEVVYAEMARGVAQGGGWLDPQFAGARFQYRPIGITWMQAATGAVLGAGAQDAISTYRLPSLAGAVAAVMALFILFRPLVGAPLSFAAAGLTAVSPVFAVQAELAIPEGPLLLAMFVAQACLLRIYCASDGERTFSLAMLFWGAQGLGILLNAFSVPILSLATLIALYAFDRGAAWLRRLHALPGVVLMCAIGAPWLLVRAHIDGGIPFAGMDTGALLKALGGAQAMKWKALPLTFTLGLLIAALPAAPMLKPAAGGLWRRRSEPLHRFLLAWIVGYLIYLELIASKPALYTVQAMLPAVMLAVALALRGKGRSRLLSFPESATTVPVWLSALFGAALPVAALLYAREWPSPLGAIGIAGVAALFGLAALAVRARQAQAWLALAIAAFGALFVVFFAIVMPGLQRAWPAPRLAAAVAPLVTCAGQRPLIVGLREPSANFVFGDAAIVEPDAAVDHNGPLIVESRSLSAVTTAAKQRGRSLPPPQFCVEALDVMRGCRLRFAVHVPAGTQCPAVRDASCAQLGWPWPDAEKVDTRCR